MNKYIKLILMITVGLNMQGCAKLWPYKSDFDCPTPKGERCKSLYDINKMADDGKFAPFAGESVKTIKTNNKQKPICKNCIW